MVILLSGTSFQTETCSTLAKELTKHLSKAVDLFTRFFFMLFNIIKESQYLLLVKATPSFKNIFIKHVD